MTTTIHPSTDQTLEKDVKRRGFTLTEIAIVLGIIGLILGAIWVAAAAVYNNLRNSRATTELLSISQATRALYATSTVTGVAAGTDMTAGMIKSGVFPADALDTGLAATAVNAVGPWTNSLITIYSETSAGGAAGDSFQIGFGGIPQASCIYLLTANTGASRDPGLIGASGSAGTASTKAPAAAPTTIAGGAGFPVSVVSATGPGAGGCATGPTNLSNASFTFYLRGG